MTLSILLTLLDIIVDSQKTTLEFDTSRSFEGSVDNMAVSLQGIRIKDQSNGKTQWFEFAGPGMGFSAGLPFGFSFSDEDFPSFGGFIHKGPTGWGKLNFDDLSGPGHIFEIYIPPVSKSLILFNEYSDPLLFTGAIITEGTCLGTISPGVTIYKGVWYRVEN